jgi:hypothetical protein
MDILMSEYGSVEQETRRREKNYTLSLHTLPMVSYTTDKKTALSRDSRMTPSSMKLKNDSSITTK